MNFTCKLAPSYPARDHLAVLLWLRPERGPNLARVPGRDTCVVVADRQTTHAYHTRRKECCCEIGGNSVNDRGSFEMKVFNHCKKFLSFMPSLTNILTRVYQLLSTLLLQLTPVHSDFYLIWMHQAQQRWVHIHHSFSMFYKKQTNMFLYVFPVHK